MTLYGGNDLYSNHEMMCVINECDHLISEKRRPYEPACIQAQLQPSHGDLAGLVVESTYARMGAVLN